MKIICIARNYQAHIAELDGDRVCDTESKPPRPLPPSEPQFFMKPDTALLRNNDPFYVPDWCRQVDYECELVVKINRVGRAIQQKFAYRYYDEVGLGIDFTARDIQREVIEKGLPWEICKAFDRSAALSTRFLPLAELGGDVQNLRFEMRLNGEVRQQGYTGDMMFSVDEIISYVSRFVTLKMGDLIYTGTPVGVGPVVPGDYLTATLEGEELLDFQIK